METRSRKRAEAPPSSSSGVSTRASKRRRLTSAVANSRILTKGVSMDESSGSGHRGRRGKNHVVDKVKESSDKGKEKEIDVRVRGNEVERMLGLKIESNRDDDEDGDSEDEDSDEDGVGMLHSNLTSASSALQGLLRRLGAGLDDLLPSSAMAAASGSHQSGRLKKILVGLRADGEEGKQVEALTQLCDMLSIGTEDSLSTFPVDSFVPVLVGLLGYESNPDIMLLAARAITHLCDVLPSSCSAVVHYGAVSCFVNRLVAIQYMDLAEQVSFCHLLHSGNDNCYKFRLNELLVRLRSLYIKMLILFWTVSTSSEKDIPGAPNCLLTCRCIDSSVVIS